MAGKQGLSSDSSMSQADKDRIHSDGGKASHTTGNTTSSSTRSTGAGSRTTSTNKSGKTNLTKEDQRKGGRS